MDKIDFNFIDIEIPDFNPEFFVLWLAGISSSFEKEVGALTYIFVTDDYLLQMNREHLSHDYYTDVITFDYNEENSLNGDIFISYDRIKENAQEFCEGRVEDELCRVMAHGLLHLIGFNDKEETEKTEMKEKEEFCLSLRKSFT